MTRPLAAVLLLALAAPAPAAEPKVRVVLWFDTEDYVLPASDDAALRVADWLTRENIPATFKVVGEKARTLERRGRTDVIEALKKHEIGYHSNWHSVQPTPAVYLSNLGWDEGVAEFDRREGPGLADLKRVFGQSPSCYGQPGSSWGPQSFGAMKKWSVPVYLDSGKHVSLDGKPHYFGGALTLYRLDHHVRSKLAGPEDQKRTEDAFVAARRKLLADGGGVVSVYYHPCEFVHKEFWDGVNFARGANPPRELWKLPAMKSAEESRAAYENFEGYLRFVKRFIDVEFVTARGLADHYRDAAQGRRFEPAELREIAAAVTADVSYQTRDGYALAASEVFALLNEHFLTGAAVTLGGTPWGPTGLVPPLAEPVPADAGQFRRTAEDVADHLKAQGRVPSAVWLGGTPVPPEAYLVALAKAVAGKAGEAVEVRPARLAAARHVHDDDPSLWGWVIFPRGFRAPAMMDLAKRQAWTVKPALARGG